ncbi:hypothetical protein ASG85_09455 [Paenibacillus sp. Soil724D2]|nr:hypothetical protein ASG85_09455 [Paenibacillus sp. Soil724D2]
MQGITDREGRLLHNAEFGSKRRTTVRFQQEWVMASEWQVDKGIIGKFFEIGNEWALKDGKLVAVQVKTQDQKAFIDLLKAFA